MGGRRAGRQAKQADPAPAGINAGRARPLLPLLMETLLARSPAEQLADLLGRYQ